VGACHALIDRAGIRSGFVKTLGDDRVQPRTGALEHLEVGLHHIDRRQVAAADRVADRYGGALCQR
jgi:hypothetical protein